jgi:hypothetical protein
MDARYAVEITVDMSQQISTISSQEDAERLISILSRSARHTIAVGSKESSQEPTASEDSKKNTEPNKEC